ncbi:hypothetical protein CDCA_CDCA03G0998 [Cyanidium caldarium]|uniref:Uncharacterized protein n=1 Tax=Cyanidium caldarium TaxID=2771 RepID=A0AAV9IRU2_CYACA|nr:hypothetical protein CDCA_CDCA03G0998 [Cyanidium caldarium]
MHAAVTFVIPVCGIKPVATLRRQRTSSERSDPRLSPPPAAWTRPVSVRRGRALACLRGNLQAGATSDCSARGDVGTCVLRNGTLHIGALVAGTADLSFADQFRECLAKVDATLERAGSSRADLVSVTIYVARAEHGSAWEPLWREWIGQTKVAVTAVVASPTVSGRLVQVSAAADVTTSPSSAVRTTAAALAVGPYNQAVRDRRTGTVYVSGCIGLRPPPQSDMVGDNVAAQTAQALANMKAILEASGSSVRHIVKTTILLEDIVDFPVVNAIYEAWLREHGCTDDRLPARSTFAAKALPKGAKFEIECIALSV